MTLLAAVALRWLTLSIGRIPVVERTLVGLLIAFFSFNTAMSLAQLDEGNLYDNHSYFEARQAFLDGDENISDEMWTTDFSTGQECWPEAK